MQLDKYLTVGGTGERVYVGNGGERLKFWSHSGPLLFLSKSVYTEILKVFLVLYTFVSILFSSFCHAFIILIDSDFKDQIVRYKAIR